MKSRLALPCTLSLTLLLLAVILAALSARSIPAQITPQPTPPTQEGVAGSILDSNPLDAASPAVERPTLPVATYQKIFPFSSEITLKGVYGTHSTYFSIPAYWETAYVFAQIACTLSSLIEDVPASLTFSLNGVPVASYRLDYRAGRTQTMYVPLPLSLLREGYNEFSVGGYVRLYDGEGCIDDLAGANWVSIAAESLIEAGYEAKPFDGLLSSYPYPFSSTMRETGAGTAVCVSDAISDGELAAALLLRAGLAAETEGKDEVILTTLSSEEAQRAQKRIIIGETKNLPSAYLSLLTNGAELPDLSSRALVRVLEWGGSPLLLLVSDDPDCLSEAAVMLLDEARVTQEYATQTFVNKGAGDPVREASANALAANRYTLEGITGGGLAFIGPFHQEKEVILPFSGGMLPAEGGKMALHFRYSKNLAFERALMTVFWGDIPVASKRLTAERADDDELSFTLPPDVIGKAARSIRIAFDLELPDLFCTPRADEMPWAYVTEESSFFLPAESSGTLSFETRPAPFQLADSLDLTVVIPDEPDAAELDALGSTVSVYATGASPYGRLHVKRAGALTEDEKGGNLLLFGTYEANSAIRAMNSALSFGFSEDGSAFLSNEQLILSPVYAADAVSLQLVRSPYAEGRTVLIVTTPQSSAFKTLDAFLRMEKNLWTLQGDTVLLDPRGDSKSFTFLTDTPGTKPQLLDTLLENRSSLLFALAATASVLILLIATTIVLIRAAAHRRKE